MQELKELLFEVRDGKIAIITINRPAVRNSMTAESWTEFNICLDEIEANPEIRVLIITGAGEKSFISGADIVTLKTRPPMYQFRTPYSADAAIRLEKLHIPVIAAVNGFAFGAGCETCLACDIRVASKNAKFGLPEVNLGILPGAGGTQRLARIVGLGIAKEVILAGRVLTADEAKQCGLVMKVVEQEELIESVQSVKDVVATLPAGTAVLLELKNIYGRFNYTSGLTDAEMASNINTAAVDELITEITSRNLYAIALVPAFRERNYVLKRNAYFLKTSNGYGWEDDQNCYWLDPTETGTMNWLIQITEELRTLGFDEVVFTEFRFPSSDRISFKGDPQAAIQNAANRLVETCGSTNFTVSFATNDTAFQLPEGGMSRLYLENVGAKDVEAAAAKITVDDPVTKLVFLATTSDTRYDKYSALRPIVIVNGQ